MKQVARGEVLEMTRGVVLLGIEDQQMWEVEIEWGDWEVIGESRLSSSLLSTSSTVLSFLSWEKLTSFTSCFIVSHRTLPLANSQSLRRSLPRRVALDLHPRVPQVLCS